MAKKAWAGWVLAGIALTTFTVGGISVMAGLIMVGFMGARDIWGWGEARSIGYLFFLVGACLSVFGVLVMRIMRNRY